MVQVLVPILVLAVLAAPVKVFYLALVVACNKGDYNAFIGGSEGKEE